MSKHYISYLLRLWKTDAQGKATWRVMLEDPHTHEVSGFNSLGEFFSYLQILVADENADSDDQDTFAENQSNRYGGS